MKLGTFIVLFLILTVASPFIAADVNEYAVTHTQGIGVLDGLDVTRALADLSGLVAINKHTQELAKLNALIQEALAEKQDSNTIKTLRNRQALLISRVQQWQRATALISGLAATGRDGLDEGNQRKKTGKLEHATAGISHLLRTADLMKTAPSPRYLKTRAALALTSLVAALARNRYTRHESNTTLRTILSLVHKLAPLIQYHLARGDAEKTALSRLAYTAQMGNLALSLDPLAPWTAQEDAEHSTLRAHDLAQLALTDVKNQFDNEAALDEGFSTVTKHSKAANGFATIASTSLAHSKAQAARRALEDAQQPHYEVFAHTTANKVEELAEEITDSSPPEGDASTLEALEQLTGNTNHFASKASTDKARSDAQRANDALQAAREKIAAKKKRKEQAEEQRRKEEAEEQRRKQEADEAARKQEEDDEKARKEEERKQKEAEDKAAAARAAQEQAERDAATAQAQAKEAARKAAQAAQEERQKQEAARKAADAVAKQKAEQERKQAEEQRAAALRAEQEAQRNAKEEAERAERAKRDAAAAEEAARKRAEERAAAEAKRKEEADKRLEEIKSQLRSELESALSTLTDFYDKALANPHNTCAALKKAATSIFSKENELKRYNTPLDDETDALLKRFNAELNGITRKIDGHANDHWKDDDLAIRQLERDKTAAYGDTEDDFLTKEKRKIERLKALAAAATEKRNALRSYNCLLDSWLHHFPAAKSAWSNERSLSTKKDILERISKDLSDAIHNIERTADFAQRKLYEIEHGELLKRAEPLIDEVLGSYIQWDTREDREEKRELSEREAYRRECDPFYAAKGPDHWAKMYRPQLDDLYAAQDKRRREKAIARFERHNKSNRSLEEYKAFIQLCNRASYDPSRCYSADDVRRRALTPEVLTNAQRLLTETGRAKFNKR